MLESGNSEASAYSAGLAALDRAVREEPVNLWILENMAWVLMGTGYHEEALSFAERFVNLDPLSPAANVTLLEAQWAVGHVASEVRVPLETFVQLSRDKTQWYFGELHLRAGLDDIAIPYFEAWLEARGYPDSSWVRELVTGGRCPETGQAFLDRRIPEIVASLPQKQKDGLRWLTSFWYNHFGFTDRFYDFVFEYELTSPWTDALYLIHDGTVNRRSGFTAHPKYLEVAESIGLFDVWEQRGPPDYCNKLEAQWVCE